MLKSKTLYSVDPKDYLRGNIQVTLRVIGVFDTNKVHWSYYAVYTTTSVSTNTLNMTDDIGSGKGIISCNTDFVSLLLFYPNLYGVKFADMDSAKKYIDDFKIKWETGSNNTIQEVRDQKLKELTDES